MEKLEFSFFFFFFFLAFGLSLAETSKPHVVDSFNLKYIQMKEEDRCPYTVVISTSCESSKSISDDQISISFGDNYGNQIYVPRLNKENPFEGTFEKCSKDTFHINGSCAYQICYAYLKAKGPHEWMPESVKINGPNTNSIAFNFSTIIPKDEWYGFNLCHDHHHDDGDSSHQVSTNKIFLYVLLLGFVLSFWLE